MVNGERNEIPASLERSSGRARGGPSPPDIDDEEFEKLQQRLFGDKVKQGGAAEPSTSVRKTRSARGRKT